MAWLLFFTRCDVFCDLLQYTDTKKCNLFVLYNKNSNGLWKDLGGMTKEKQVCWRGFDAICVCPLISLLIDHGQQPMKMPTEVTLLYKYISRQLYSVWFITWLGWQFIYLLHKSPTRMVDHLKAKIYEYTFFFFQLCQLVEREFTNLISSTESNRSNADTEVTFSREMFVAFTNVL